MMCQCGHQQVRHAADQGFCHLCSCAAYRPQTRAAAGKVPCLGCGKDINPKYTLCGACAEDMGYSRRPR